MDEAITRRLTDAGVPFRLHAHAPAVTVEDPAARLPFPPAAFLKTVAFRVKGGGWVLVALRGADQVDYRKLAAALGVKRGDLDRPDAATVAAALGFAPGGVCPISPDSATQALFDSRAAADLDVVYCGAGRDDRTLEIRLDDLIRVAGGRVAPLARDPAAG